MPSQRNCRPRSQLLDYLRKTTNATCKQARTDGSPLRNRPPKAPFYSARFKKVSFRPVPSDDALRNYPFGCMTRLLGIGYLQLAAHPDERLLLDRCVLAKSGQPVDLHVATEPRQLALRISACRLLNCGLRFFEFHFTVQHGA
jgi:hypothetical protein